MRNETTLEEIRTILLSLLVARPNWTPVSVLDNDYYEAEGKRIPWRSLGYAGVVEFLQSMPQYFNVERSGNVTFVRGIASDKSKHVRSLVSRQKKTVTKHGPSSRYRSSYVPYVPRQRPKIPAKQLNDIVQYVRNSPESVSINKVIMIMKNQLPHITLTENDIRDQLRELGHHLYFDGDIIRPVLKNSSTSQMNTTSHSQSPLPASEPPSYKTSEPPTSKVPSYKTSEPSTSKLPSYKTSEPSTSKLPSYKTSEPSTSKVVYTVPEEYPNLVDVDDDYDEDDFVRPSSYCLRRPKTDERIASSLKEHCSYEPTFGYHDFHKRTEEERYDNVNNAEYSVNPDMIEKESNDNLSDLISDKMRSRLKQLVQKYPNGIRCSELPQLYMKEYKMPLNYADLGFNSVSTYTSYLPDIFYLARKNTNEDFILYSADKRPKHQDTAEHKNQETSKSYAQETTSRTRPINIPSSRYELHNVDEDNGPFPSDLSPSILDKFAPENVTTTYEDIKHILVTDLEKNTKGFIEVYVVEIFTPSFFWIHLRQNTKHFKMFMNELHSFYDKHYESYTIPKLALKRGLNCACIYGGNWHRAVIKTVKPDFRVTVMFYDYGTQKTYAAEDLYYLHSNFSYLAAQAIPCGLYNVKPYVGDRWKKSVTDRFIDKIADVGLLAAKISSVDPPNNSMLVILVDTTEPQDVDINDWLVQENLARRGKMGDSVDMASLSKYVVNNKDSLPTYCYAEENLIVDSCSKSTTTEEPSETPLVSSILNFTCRDNNQYPHSKPPGFPSGSEHLDRFNTPTNCHRSSVYSTFGSASSGKTSFSDLIEEMMNNSHLEGNPKPSATSATSDAFYDEAEKQLFMQTTQESMMLQIHLTALFCQLLKSPPTTKNLFARYSAMLFNLNKVLKKLVTEMESTLAPNPSRNYANDVGPSMFQFNQNCEGFVKQENASLSRPPPLVSSSTNPLAEHHKQYPHHHTSFFAPDMKDFPYMTHARNFEQTSSNIGISSYQTDANSPHIQSSPGVSCGLPMFNNLAKDIHSFINQPTQTPMPTSVASPMTTVPHISTSNINPSSHSYNMNEFINAYLQCENTCKNENPTQWKETNPFKYPNPDVEAQIPVIQSEKTNYDVANLSSYLSNIDLQSHAPMVDNTNAHMTDYKFPGTYENTARNEPNFVPTVCNVNANSGGDYAPKIVYEAGPVMYNLQKKPEESQLPSQLANQLQGNIVNNDVGHVVPLTAPIALNDEGYVTPTALVQNSSSTLSKENCYQPDIGLNVLPRHALPEAWSGSMFQNNDPVQSHCNSSVTPTVSQPANLLPNKERYCATDELTTGDSCRTAESNYATLFYDNERKIMLTNLRNPSLNMDQNRTALCDCTMPLNKSFLFQPINSVKGVTILFHMDEDGWMLIHEFVEVFTKFSRCSRLIALLDTMNVSISVKEVRRSDYPVKFSQLDSYPLKVTRDSENCIISINLISLQTALGLLCKLKIVSREEIESAFKRTEVPIENPAMYSMWTLIITYKDFKHRIEQCSTNYGI